MIWEYKGVKYQRQLVKAFRCDGCAFLDDPLKEPCIQGFAPCMADPDGIPKYYIFKEIKDETQTL